MKSLKNILHIMLRGYRREIGSIALTIMFAVAVIFTLKGDYPIVRNFTKHLYDADTQNWDISQTSDGTMLFANKRGLLIFTGSAWQLLPLDNHGAARSVLPDSVSKRIYVGGSWTFGYFSASAEHPQLKYHSLMETLDSKPGHIGDIWNIMKIGNDYYFQGDYDLFRYNGKNTSHIKIGEKILATGVIDDRLYVALRNGRFCRLENDRLIELSGVEGLGGTSAASITPHPLVPGKGLLVTAFSGCFSFDSMSVERFETGLESFMKEAQVFCAATDGPQVAFGTVSNGVAIKNFRTGKTTFVNKNGGLQNTTVLSVFFDRQQNIWLGLDNGIDYVWNNSPIKLLLPPGESLGTGYVSCMINGVLLIGTNQGLYSLPYSEGESAGDINPHRELSGQVWSIVNLGKEVAVSSDLGVFIGTPGALREIGKIGGAWNVAKVDENTLVVSSYDNYHLLEFDGSGWRDRGIISGFNEANAKLKVAGDGSLWLADWQKGLYRLRLDKDARRFYDVRHFTDKDGLPYALNVTVEVIDGRVIVGTVAGFYTLGTDGKLHQSQEINRRLPFYKTAHIYGEESGSLWGLTGNSILYSPMGAGGNVAPTDTLTFNYTADNLVPGFDNLSFIGDKVISASEDGFYVFEPRNIEPDHWSPGVGITGLELDNDSTISTYGLEAEKGELVLPNKTASVRFFASLPEFRKEDAATYSFYLEGYDDDWSVYTTSSSKEYTKLGYGRYTLHVRAKNSIDGHTSEATLAFRVATPWYWSVVARIIYACILIAILVIGYRFLTRYASDKAKQVEAKKEQEIVQLKQAADESERESRDRIENLKKEQKEKEFSHHQESLENATRNTMHRNEVLLRISDKLSKLRESIPLNDQKGVVADKRVEEVQQLIDETLERDDTLTQVDRHFEGVYSDYVERLKEQFPDLTQSEFRLCCFIKMGLSTKEIAPLMSVAPKSVEMFRYRVRKKMNLNNRENLRDFLQNF